MNLPWPWQCLDLDRSASVAAVRRRYAELLKLNRPEDNPDGFQQLRRAYEICLSFAREREAEADAQTADGEVAVAAAPVAIAAERTRETAAVSISSAIPTAHAQPIHAVTVVDAGPATESMPPLPRHPAEDPAPQEPSIALPAMRPPNVVVDELLVLDRNTPPDDDAFARYFAECPELASFVSRNDVELELLHRITAGARPTLRALQVFGAAFGWRQLGHERHLLQLGVPRDALKHIDEALFRAGAEAQFEWHVSTKPRLIQSGDDTIDVEREIAILRKLRELRDKPPEFRALLSSSRLTRVMRLFDGWTQRYGNAATLYLFGTDNVAYWRRASPRAEANLLQSLAGAARAGIVGLWILAALVLMGIAMALRSRDHSLLPLFEAIGMLLAVGVPLIIILHGWRLAAARSTEFARFVDAQQEAWRERHLAKWLVPARAIPACVALGMLWGGAIFRGNWVAETIALVGVCLCAFGWRSLGALTLYAAMAWGGVRVCVGELTLLPSLAAGGLPLLLVWVADRIARSRLRLDSAATRWRRIISHSFLLSFFAFALSVVGAAVYKNMP
jgi:hypothetical protein